MFSTVLILSIKQIKIPLNLICAETLHSVIMAEIKYFPKDSQKKIFLNQSSFFEFDNERNTYFYHFYEDIQIGDKLLENTKPLNELIIGISRIISLDGNSEYVVHV